jgi:hypothetical protein
MSKHKNKHHRQPTQIYPVSKLSTQAISFDDILINIERFSSLSTKIFNNIATETDGSKQGGQAVQFVIDAGTLRLHLQELDAQLALQIATLNTTYLVAKG